MNGNNNNYHYTEYGDEMSLASYNSIIGAVLSGGLRLVQLSSIWPVITS